MVYESKYKIIGDCVGRRKKLRSFVRYSEYNYISLEDVMPLTYEDAM